MTVVHVAVAVPLPQLFDYLPPEGEAPPPDGSRVRVPFGRGSRVGLVTGSGAPSADSPAELKRITRVLDPGLIPPELLGLLAWCTDYYQGPPGERVNLALPVALRRLKPFRTPPPPAMALTRAGRDADLSAAPSQQAIRQALENGPRTRVELLEIGGADTLRRMLRLDRIRPASPPVPESRPGPELNAGQRGALAAILAARHGYRALLLAGVTGSGKTEVYLQAARRMLRRGRQVLMLLPEIGLTPQLVRRIEARLGERAWVFHSGLSDGERLATWQAARDGTARVVVGTRSAVFLPLCAPGLIVVDEEHDGSFKQADSIRYHARDVAVMRAARLGIPVVLGSATPSLESLNNAASGRYKLLELPARAGGAEMPSWRVVDTRGERAPGGLTPALMAAIADRIGRGEQVLLYRNRRGYAPVLLCDECGWQGDCARCSAHLTWHRGGQRLVCHHCGHAEPVPPRCPACYAPNLRGQGAGTQRLEQLLAERFPQVPVYRADRDALGGRDDFEALLAQVASGDPCILVGTQMLAKGHHLPGITLAVVLDADQALYSADFRAPERLAQAVFQVAGRAGRGTQRGTFILQTRHPEHGLIGQLAGGSYLTLARDLLDERRAAGLPPARPLALLRAEARQPEPARDFLHRAQPILAGAGIEAHGPVPAILHQRAGYWRFQLWLQTDRRKGLGEALARALPRIRELSGIRRVRWHLDRDPLEL